MRLAWVWMVACALACGDDDGGADSGTDSGRDAPMTDTNGEDAPEQDGGEDAAVDSSSPDAMPPEACALPAPIDEDVTYDNTLYVAVGGSGDGSEGDPFGDIEQAVAAAGPSTRIVVREGTYDAVGSISPQGEEGRPIKIEGEGDVIIDAGGSGNTGWSMSDPRYVVIEGFTIMNSGVHGMNIDDGGTYETPGEFLVLRDITIPSAGSGGNNDCIKMSGIDDFWVLNSDVAGCDRGEIIDMVGCHRGVIANNAFASPVGNGVQAKGGSSDTIVANNVFTDIPGRAVNAGGSTGLEFFRPIDAPFEAARIRVVSNLFIRGGTESGTPIAFVGCDACEFLNNTVIEPSGWMARILQETVDARFVPSRDGVFANNIVVVNIADLRSWFNVGTNTAPDTFRFTNNLWFALDDDGFTGPLYSGGIPNGMNDIVLDPMMVDRAGGDYRLMDESPAIGAGTDVGVLPPDLDAMCYDDPPTLGAYTR